MEIRNLKAITKKESVMDKYKDLMRKEIKQQANFTKMESWHKIMRRQGVLSFDFCQILVVE